MFNEARKQVAPIKVKKPQEIELRGQIGHFNGKVYFCYWFGLSDAKAWCHFKVISCITYFQNNVLYHQEILALKRPILEMVISGHLLIFGGYRACMDCRWLSMFIYIC